MEPLTGMRIYLDSFPDSWIAQVRMHHQECQPKTPEIHHNRQDPPINLEVYALEVRAKHATHGALLSGLLERAEKPPAANTPSSKDITPPTTPSTWIDGTAHRPGEYKRIGAYQWSPMGAYEIAPYRDVSRAFEQANLATRTNTARITALAQAYSQANADYLAEINATSTPDTQERTSATSATTTPNPQSDTDTDTDTHHSDTDIFAHVIDATDSTPRQCFIDLI